MVFLALAVFAYVSPEWAGTSEDIGKLLGAIVLGIAIYAAFEARQRKVIRWIVGEVVEEKVGPIKDEIVAAEQRMAHVEGALGVPDRRRGEERRSGGDRRQFGPQHPQ